MSQSIFAQKLRTIIAFFFKFSLLRHSPALPIGNLTFRSSHSRAPSSSRNSIALRALLSSAPVASPRNPPPSNSMPSQRGMPGSTQAFKHTRTYTPIATQALQTFSHPPLPLLRGAQVALLCSPSSHPPLLAYLITGILFKGDQLDQSHRTQRELTDKQSQTHTHSDFNSPHDSWTAVLSAGRI